MPQNSDQWDVSKSDVCTFYGTISLPGLPLSQAVAWIVRSTGLEWHHGEMGEQIGAGSATQQHEKSNSSLSPLCTFVTHFEICFIFKPLLF